MSLSTIVRMTNDGDLQQRFMACAAQQDIPNPDSWVINNKWPLMATDEGAIESYKYAVETDVMRLGNYGRNEAIITDEKILSMVQSLRAAQLLAEQGSSE